MMGEHACFMQTLTTVPLYDTLGVEAIGNHQNILQNRIYNQSNGNDYNSSYKG
jgi:hypothetical protein